MNKTYLVIFILVLIFGTGSFFVGIKYQESKSSASRIGNFQGTRNGSSRFAGEADNFRQRAQGFRPVNGEIIDADDKSITVKLQDGSSKIVLLSDTATISKSADATRTDLKIGEKIVAFGTENSDGSITAQNIQINPVLRSGDLDKKVNP